jgi:hypothetical protein
VTNNRGARLVAAAVVVLLAPVSIADGTRSLGTCYTPGLPLSVSIAANPLVTVQVYAVEDAPPAGWTVADITESGQWDAVNNKVKWGPFFDHTPRTLAYRATPPGGERGSKAFSGTLSADGVNTAIGGASAVGPCAGNARAARSLPACYAPGSPAAVSITTTPGAGTQAHAVEDAPPPGWAVSSISDSGSFDQVNGKVKWGPFFDATARTLTYSATPPSGEAGTRTFTGTISADGFSVAVAGTSTLGVCQTDGPDLTGTWSGVTHPCKTKKSVTTCKLKGRFTVRNAGNQSAASVPVYMYLAATPTSQDTLFKRVATGTLSVGKSKSFSVAYTGRKNVVFHGMYAVAVIDPSDTAHDSDRSNNVVVVPLD